MNQYIVTEEKIQKWVELDYSAKDCRNEVKEHSYNPQAERDVKELFRDEIAKWKDEDPLFMAYVYGQEAGKKEELEKVLDEIIGFMKNKIRLPTNSGEHLSYEADIRFKVISEVKKELRQIGEL